MRTVEIKNGSGSLSAYFPTRDDVTSLKVGDMAPNCFGRMAQVSEITCQRDDVNGKAFVCFYAIYGSNGTMSGSLKEDEILRTVNLSNHFRSAEIDAAEKLALSVVRPGESELGSNRFAVTLAR
jgi:hypothetical protein